MRKDKERKTKETKIGKIIYGFLLFMPLLAIFITCGYAMFNKNAYKSYSGTTSNEYTETLVNSFNELKTGYRYRFTGRNEATTTNSSKRILISDVEVINTNADSNFVNLLENQADSFSTNSIKYIILYENNTSISSLELSSVSLIFDFTCMGYTNPTNLTFTEAFDSMISKLEYNQVHYVDNVFYYSVDKVEQSNLFNWAQNSVIYTGIHNTCTQLSITNTFIPLLMTYWLIISVVYILYDIILMMLILFHRKVHELQDSI